MPRFIHPAHSRGLRSSSFNPPLTDLTDKKIHNYTLAGKYGKAKQEALVKELEAKKAKRSKKKIKTQVSFKDFKHLL